MTDALISIKPEFVDKIVNGQKTVEIRTRKVQLDKNSKLWIYTTLPKGSVQVLTYVKHVDFGHPTTIWSKYGSSIGISRKTFDQYVNGSKSISAIVTEGTCKLPYEISLQNIRSIVPDFQPPQFIKRMDDEDPVLMAILKILSENQI